MGNPASLHATLTAGGSGPAADWLLTPEERRSLRSTRRFFHVGLAVAASAVAAGAWIMWGALRGPRPPGALPALMLAFAGLLTAAWWCTGRARVIGRDIQQGRVDARWGRVTRIFRRLRVAEIDGVLFPLQVTPLPTLRPGERVWVRFAPQSRIALGIRTLREVVAAERLAGRPICSAILADLDREPPASGSPHPGSG